MAYLVHCTRTIESLTSILTTGLAYTTNPTGIFRDLFGAVGKQVPDIERGMISFTNLDPDNLDANARTILAKFGPLGVAVKYAWATDHGGRFVAYVPSNGKVFSAFVDLLTSCLPIVGPLANADDRDRKVITDMLLSEPGLPDIFTNPLFSLLLELLMWVETDQHANEREFRIRAQQTAGGFSSFSKSEQVNLAKTMHSHFHLPTVLPISPNDLVFLLAPKEFSQIEHLLKDINLSGIPIKYYG